MSGTGAQLNVRCWRNLDITIPRPALALNRATLLVDDRAYADAKRRRNFLQYRSGWITNASLQP